MAWSSLFIGATGLVTHGERMQVVGNNLANVSTTGFKKSDALFSDLMYQQVATGGSHLPSGAMQMSQKGMGVQVSEIATNFRPGGLEDTDTATDLAVGGNGFFGVRSAEGGMYYTRAGTFRFDNLGYLRDPNGHYLQGAVVDRETGEVGGSTDVRLPWDTVEINGVDTQVVYSDPLATTEVSISTNLDYPTADSHGDSANPFFSLLRQWNGLNEDPMGSFNGYQTGITVYDENGDTHRLSVYYDRVDESYLSNAAGGKRYWEFVVAIDPEEDGRAGMVGTSSAGLLATGVFTFNRYGELESQAVYSLTDGADPTVLSSWGLSGFNENGVPAVNVTFDGATEQQIGLNFGLTSSNATWDSGALNAGAVGRDVAALGEMANPDLDAYVSTTNYNTGSASLYQDQNGYGQGYLQSVNVDRDGYLNATFTNGQTEPLYRINLYRFNSEYGLRHEGGNLFAATEASGAAIEGSPQEGGCGSVYGQTLENSNVDMAEEFAQMIITQRGFQSNTKVITTTDSIMSTLISIKR